MPPKTTGVSGLARRTAAPPVPHANPDEVYAALDLGTNSCRMLLAQPRSGTLDVIDSFSKAVQLGVGLEGSGRLSRPAIQRTINALRICRRKLAQHNVRRMRLVATEACRRASNSKAFIEAVRRETGLSIDVISAEEEARLAVISCAPLVKPETEQLLVVDIGGGSTELVWLDLSDVAPVRRREAILDMHGGSLTGDTGQVRVVDWISVPLGVATLRDQFIDVEDDCGCFALMSCHFEEHLSDFLPYGRDHDRKGFQIVGTSGTITTVAASFLGLKRYDRGLVDGLDMTSDQINGVIREYLSLGPAGRRCDPRIGRDRHTLIMPGVAILQALLRTWPTDHLLAADRGLREGLLYAQMRADGVLEPATPKPALAAGQTI
ncbi:Ppx/GppA family phosphatase [Mangrovicoccus sp. HB182678]|uniref:Ppx/GppA family phosphatase n=1 Tax=Mangrovicoccus algicola TaxID=2771008 RepID=A0A8J6YT63_9RHOB|nr:Ppx/GppA phosphatase family protein [Mangrovicoccus algicola]MBE3637165.1 Ppx/GppA family phosphatase [Mangrovicoccus algicola]